MGKSLGGFYFPSTYTQIYYTNYKNVSKCANINELDSYKENILYSSPFPVSLFSTKITFILPNVTKKFKISLLSKNN